MCNGYSTHTETCHQTFTQAKGNRPPACITQITFIYRIPNIKCMVNGSKRLPQRSHIKIGAILIFLSVFAVFNLPSFPDEAVIM